MSNIQSYFKSNFNSKRPSTFVVSVKKNKNGMLDELVSSTKFLEESYPNLSINHRLYHFINNIDQVLHCRYCNSPLQVKPFNARLVGSDFYNGTCGKVECMRKLNSENSIAGCLEKHGVVNISQTEGWHTKVKKTNLEKRGVEWNTQIQACKDGATSYRKANPNFMLDRMPTRQSTYLTKHGVNHHMQNIDNLSKNVSAWFKYKDYTLPSGKIIKVQGYEPKALDQLLLKYKEEDLLIKDSDISDKIGTIMYLHGGTTHRYYPDIFIIPENKIIEVKSQYTMAKGLEINLAKRDACITAGFNFEFMIL